MILGVLASSLSASKPIKVVASTSIFADMAEEIGGERVEVSTVVKLGADPHGYDPVPSDVQMVKEAQVVLINGLTLEGWIGKLIYNSGSSALVDTITRGVSPIASDEYEDAYDPHAWMVADNGVLYAHNIFQALSKVDPEGKSYYLKRYNTYSEKLRQLDIYIRNQILRIPIEKRLLVTSHDAFAYFAKAYGMRVAAVKGVSTEAEARTSDIQRVSKEIRDSGVPAIFVESTINPKIINELARANKVKIGGELYADSLGEEGSEGDTYIGMLQHNTDQIVSALTGASRYQGGGHQHSKTPWSLYGVLVLLLAASLVFFVNKF